jgi:4-amino-4-deoxy-L-arabinose transferase-like glycosyltransferase
MKIAPFDIKKIIPALVVLFFFGAYLLLGYLIYKDYGVSADEMSDYSEGKINYDLFMGSKLAQFTNGCTPSDTVCHYPPLFSILLYAYAPTGDSQAILWHRHQLTFAFFAFSVFIFFLIGKKIFKDWKIGLLGALFLIISPRIFAHSFYNPKDIPFLSAYVIAIYTLLLFLEKKNVFTAILHGIAMGVMCSIRTPGLIIIPITFFFYLFDLFLSRDKWKSYLKAGLFLLISLIIAAGLVYWFTPILYTHPIENYIQTFNVMKQFPWNGYQLYMGKDISNQIPWHYSIVWFSISSPVFYLLLFLLGGITLVIRTFKARLRGHFQSMRDLYLVGACGVLPIIIVILMKSVLYTDNRQMYFVYPPLLLISLYGFTLLVDKLRRKTHLWQLVTAILLITGLVYPVYFMIRYHPYQATYFNFLEGSKMSVIKERFILDAWGLAVNVGLEYIARTDPAQKINVKILGGFKKAWYILPKPYRQRLNILTEQSNPKTQPPDYIIDTYRYYPIEKVTGGKAVYSIMVGDTDILTVYKVNGN